MRHLTLTQHAKMRRKQMHVTEDQIEAVVTDPDVVWPDSRYKPGEDRVIYVRGPLVVVVNRANNKVVTSSGTARRDDELAGHRWGG